MVTDVLQKTFFGIIALALSCITIELIPVARESAYWNRCFDSTISWINESPDFNKWENKAKDSLAVGVCNGAVYEPKLKTQ